MTNKTAHQMLRLEHNRISPTNPKSHALELAMLALDKQIPKPVIDVKLDNWLECPVCGNRVWYYDGYVEDLQLQNFCDNCGQALKEPEEEE